MTVTEMTYPDSPPSLLRRGARSVRAVWRSRWADVFIAPFFLFSIVFGFFPQLFSILRSLSKWSGLGPVDFIGLANFRLVFADRVFRPSMLNSVIIFFRDVPPMLFLVLVLAVLLNGRRIRGAGLFQLAIFIPYITNRIASGRTFQLLFSSTDQGLINYFLSWAGIGAVPWMENIWTARIALCLLTLWGWVGYNMILMTAGLQTIHPELNGAALIDGANPVQAFFHVTLPLMRPILLFCLVMPVMGTFNLFTIAFSLTGPGGNATAPAGGPLNATLTPLIHIYTKVFGDFRIGVRGRAPVCVLFDHFSRDARPIPAIRPRGSVR